MAIIEIPYLYEAVVIKRRQRTECRVGLADRVAVKVPEVAAEDAPLAAIHRSAPDARGAVKTTEYRAHNGRLYHAPRSRRVKVKGSDEVRVRAVRVDEVQAWLDRQGSANPFSPDYYTFDEILDDPREIRQRVRDTREEDRLAVIAKARGALFIDGQLHFETKGPSWLIGVGAGDEVPVEIETMAHGGDAFDYWLEYRGDRFADALAHARAELDRRGYADAAVPVSGTIEVLRPEALAAAWDDDWTGLGRACQDFIAHTGQRLSSWPSRGILAWVALRDALALWPSHRDAAALAAVQEARRVANAPGLRLGTRLGANEPYTPERVDAMLARLAASGGVAPAVPLPAAPQPDSALPTKGPR